MKKTIIILALFVLSLTACGPAAPDVDQPPSAGEPAPVSSAQSYPWLGQERVDQQGAVTVAVTPIASPDPGQLRFEVVMNTHSVDLSMDLTALAALAADSGQALTPASWEGPTGGHHVTGILVFSPSSEQLEALAAASTITLTIKEVDAALREFSW